MTLPKGYKRSADTRKGLRPSPQELSRPVVDWKMLKIPLYKTELVSDSTGRPDKRVKNVEIHPVEWNAQIVFSSGTTAAIPITQVYDVSVVSSPKGILKKKEDLMVKIVFIGNDAREYWIVINIEDKYIKEFLDHIEKLKHKEADETYWTYRSLTLLSGPVGQTKVVNIYPLAPFLAEGEEIIWQNMKTDPAANGKIIEIDLFTNYRVFQYNYDGHTGTSILLPSIEEVTVDNMRTHTFSKRPIGLYSQSNSYLSRIGRGINTKIIGDIVFTAEGRPFLRFLQVSDPDSLASLIKSIKKEYANMKVGGSPNKKESDIVINQQADEPIKMQSVTPNKSGSSLPVKRMNLPFKGGGPPQIKYQRYDGKIKSINTTMDITCRQCAKVNPTGSKFCNKCGFMLSSYCSKCGNSKNAADAVFCNQCGSKLGIDNDATAGVNKSSFMKDSIQQDSILEDSFLEYSLPEYGLKINYPATWTKQDTNLPPLVKVVFFSPREDLSDSYSENFALGRVDIAANMTLEALRDGYLQDLKEANPFLHESVPTTIAGIPAWQLVYTSGGVQSLDVFTVRGNKAYMFKYRSQPEKYFKFLSIIEQMISSIEFLS